MGGSVSNSPRLSFGLRVWWEGPGDLLYPASQSSPWNSVGTVPHTHFRELVVEGGRERKQFVLNQDGLGGV